MKRLLLLVCALLSGAPLFADKVTTEQARKMGERFFRSQAATRSVSPQLQLVWDGEEASTRSAASAPAFYVFNRTDAGGFVIVSGDDLAMPVLGYSLDGRFDAASLPGNLEQWMEGLRGQINEARARRVTATARVKAAWSDASYASEEPVVELETALWNQDDPYNRECPVVNGTRAVTGCVATAVAIIMRYHQWPEQPKGVVIPGYVDGGGTSVATRTLSPYDWDKLPLEYFTPSVTEEEEAEVARLMADCGAMSKATYGSSTGAVTSVAVRGMVDYMDYDKEALWAKRAAYSDSEWNELMRKELDARRPVLYDGFTARYEGHQFVLYGYTPDDYFLVNWGWGGSYNGAFLLSALDPAGQGIGGGSGAFTVGQGAILGLQPNKGGTDFQSNLSYSMASNGSTKGIYADQDEFYKDQPFTVVLSGISNHGLEDAFNGELIVTLFDEDGNVKEDISQPTPVTQPYQQQYLYTEVIPCEITRNVPANNDFIRARYRASGETEWKDLLTGDENMPDKITIRVSNVTIEQGSKFSYDKARAALSVETLYGVAYTLADASGKVVAEGETDARKMIEVDTSKLPAGTYQLVMTKGDDRKELSVVIGNQQK